MSLLPAVGLTLVLLASPGQTDAPGFAECEAASHRVDLVPGMTGVPPKACISAGLVTVFSFNTDVNRDMVVVQGRERFESFAVVGRMIVLMPRGDLAQGERFLLSVAFPDGAAPASATFSLIAHPALATRQIDVFRHARPVEAYQQEVQELRAENAQLRSRVKQLESQGLTRGGLADLLYQKLIGEQGVRASQLRDLEGSHGGALVVDASRSFHAPGMKGRVALWLRVFQPQPQEWSIKEIFLTDEHGGVFVPITWIGKDPIPPANQPHQLILEWQLEGTTVARPFALVVVGRDGRTVRVNRIMFPQ